MQELDTILQFDLDENGFPTLTQKNVKLITFIIQNDSSYRSDNDLENPMSTINLTHKYQKNPTIENLKAVIKSIDKQNKTHLSVSGKKEGDNKGIKEALAYIQTIGLSTFNQRIQEGDLTLVDELAEHMVKNRYNLSPASKICTYLSRYMYEEDKYSIYDGIMEKILPYYYWMHQKKKITITKKKVRKEGYQWYFKMIGEIIEDYPITRKEFDHLLWYYYKGEKDIKDESGKLCHPSRITRALSCVKKSS